MAKVACRVCDSPNAANHHFGAQSCKACAAFFRRSIKTGQIYDCSGDGTTACDIHHTLRLNCRHCRFTKCLQAGMIEDLVQGRPISSAPETTDRNSPRVVYYEPPRSEVVYEVFPASENEWDYVPPRKTIKTSNDLMEMDELQEFIKLPGSSRPPDDVAEENRLYALAALYMDQVVSLNMRRKLTYTENLLSTMFDGPCSCPYEKTDLRPFDHREYRHKNRNDYTMLVDYVNQFPQFQLLTKSEKTVLFQSAAAVDALIDPAYYSQVVYPDESVFVTLRGEFLNMNPLPKLELAGSEFDAKDHRMHRSLILMVRRQWKHVVEPLRKLNLSLAEFALFKALTVWHYSKCLKSADKVQPDPLSDYYKLQDAGRQISARQRDDIFRTLLLICKDEAHEDPLLRVSEIVLAVGVVMSEVHEMITSLIEIMTFDNVDDPILRNMLTFQY
ncbi:unnamed protein product [Caenorhabditis sp. 36 PRJEB53466]|nr:unnamed protein product [Caenorhabditis sp. 36 PRJEB53466]